MLPQTAIRVYKKEAMKQIFTVSSFTESATVQFAISSLVRKVFCIRRKRIQVFGNLE
jgi:hypothetical protein